MMTPLRLGDLWYIYIYSSQGNLVLSQSYDIQMQVKKSLTLIAPSAAYIRQRTGSALVQVMVCRLFGAKLLPEPIWPIVN